VPIGGFIFGFLTLGSLYGSGGLITYSVGGLIGGALLYGFGGMLRMLVRIEENSRRTIKLLEYMAKQGTATQAPASTRLRQLARAE
jgi:hypothetical protein